MSKSLCSESRKLVSPWVEAKAQWRRFQRNSNQPAAEVIKIGLVGTFTIHNLLPFVGASLISAGFQPVVTAAGYDQLFQACLDPERHFGSDVQAIALLWRIEDIFAEEFRSGVLQAGAEAVTEK